MTLESKKFLFWKLWVETFQKRNYYTTHDVKKGSKPLISIPSKRVPPEARLIGRNFRSLREQAGLTQKEIAHRLGVSFQQIQKYERGENRLPVDRLHALKNILGVSYHAFFRGLDKAESPDQSWQEKLFQRLAEIENPVLQNKIERVIAIMAE